MLELLVQGSSGNVFFGFLVRFYGLFVPLRVFVELGRPHQVTLLLQVRDFAGELHLTILLTPEPIDDLVPDS